MRDTKYIKELKRKYNNYLILGICSLILFGFFLALAILRFPAGVSVVLAMFAGACFAFSFVSDFLRGAMSKMIMLEDARRKH